MWNRRRLGKEDALRYDERLGVPSLPRPNSKLVWIHAASVGESASVLPLIEELLSGNAWIHVLVTTGTVSSARLMAERLPRRAFHQYVPIDKKEYVDEFIEYWQPDLAIWVESEFWPNLILSTKESGCPIILLNGRISDASLEKWQKYKSLGRKIVKCFDMVLPQSREDEKKLRQLGARNIKYIGNLKFGANPLPFDQQDYTALQKMLGNRMMWVAASTHPGEEEKILTAHHKIKEKNYTVLTVIVPRHPWRGSQIRQMLGTEVKVAQRSLGEPILEETEIYIADTMGELGIFYRLAPIVFIGGSFAERGGHNPIEPGHLDSAVLCGPNMQNFAEIVEEFEKAGAIQTVEDENELAFRVFELWQNPQKRTAMARLAAKLVRSKQEVLHNLIDEIEKFI